MNKFLALTAGIAVLLFSCKPDNNQQNGNDSIPEKPVAPRIKGPDFSGDSAYAFVKAQVDFGPRVPGTPAHEACGNYLIGKLKAFGATVSVQEAPATTYDGRAIRMKNIFGQYYPERKDRILLLAHWDTRHIADRDSVRQKEPILGANDGGSGVGVLLELARVLNQKDPGIGVDILFVDAEDYGEPGGASETWCLGSQYWSQHMSAGYNARFAILLDMVGAKDAVFPREGTSVYYASNVVEKVWTAAAALGYRDLFINDITGQTTDDHLFINEYARIPAIDIVHYDPMKMDYGHFHHRHSDNMDNIDPVIMKKVGSVLTDVIYNELPVVK